MMCVQEGEGNLGGEEVSQAGLLRMDYHTAGTHLGWQF